MNNIDKFNHYKDLSIKAVKEGVEEHEGGKKKPVDIGKEFLEDKGKYKKVVSAVEMVMELMPKNISEKIQKALDDRDYSELPFDMDKYSFKEKIGRGFVSKVHLLESKKLNEKSYVLKMDFYNGGDVEKLHEIATVQQTEYKAIKENFKSIPGLILEEQTLITTDKKKKTPAIATLQEFAGGDLRDVFTEIDKQELIAMLRDNDEFRKEFIEFERIVSSMDKDQNEVVDLLGNKNLSVVHVDGEPHLRFIDPHNIASTVSEGEKRLVKLQEALTYLSEIRKEIVG